MDTKKMVTLKHATFQVLDETLQELKDFSKRTKVPYAVVVRDALDVFSVLMRDAKDYPEFLSRVRAVIGGYLQAGWPSKG